MGIPFLDSITYQLETRFDKKSRICADLLVLTPTISASDKFDPASEVDNMLTWECHLPCSVQLQNEILRWKSFWQRRVDAGNEIPDAFVTAITAVSKEEFPNIYTLLCIACVLPITSCEAERSFSTLRQTKTYLRNSMLTPRLSALILMAQHTTNFNVDRVIEIFVRKHARRMCDSSICMYSTH